MEFCHKLSAQQTSVKGKNFIEQRRNAAKEGDKETYKQMVLQKKAMEQQVDS